MSRRRGYVAGAGLTGLAVAAMAWSALPPGGGPGGAVAAWTGAAIGGTLDWFRRGPADGHPDWDAASRAIHDGDPDAGPGLLVAYGCGSCHAIPGVAGARGSVGPPLRGMADRAYVAGVLPNSPAGLVRWIVDPTVHAPQTAMPDLGVTEAEARHMAAYLYSLRGG